MSENTFYSICLKVFSQSILPEQFLTSGAIDCTWRDRPCPVHCCNCVAYKIALKGGIHNCLQTFLELSKTFTDPWYKMSPLKTRLLYRFIGEVGCCIWRNYQRSWKYDSILHPMTCWHSTCVCCQIFYSLGRAVLWVWKGEIMPCVYEDTTIAGRWQLTCPFRLVKWEAIRDMDTSAIQARSHCGQYLDIVSKSRL